jgi:hypothetical protein
MAAGAGLLVIAVTLLLGPLRTLALVLLAGGGLWLGLKLKVGPIEQVWNMLLAFAGNAIGAWRAWRGERAVTWNVASSARPGSADSATGGIRPGDIRTVS